MTDLNTLLESQSSTWSLFDANAINNAGQIVGYGVVNPHNSAVHAFLLNLSNVIPTQLNWNKKQGGVDLSFQVIGNNLTKDVPIDFYWATGGDVSTIIDQEKPVYTYNVAAGTQAQDQAYGPINIAGSNLAGAPAKATYLLAVAEPDGTLASADPALNVTSLRLALTLPSVLYQTQPPWASYYLGRSTQEKIHDFGCVLTDLAMQLSYAGILTDPGTLNNELRNAPGAFFDSGDHQNDALDPLVATLDVAQDFNQAQLIFQYHTTSDPQELRDLLISSAAPIMVQVTNPRSNTAPPPGHFPHYILVTGLAGNGNFIVSDPGYQIDPTTDSSSYPETDDTNGSWFTSVGYVKDPPNSSVLDMSVSSDTPGSSIYLTDSKGNATGIDPSSGQIVNEIPDSSYFNEGPLENIDGPSDNTTTQFIAITLACKIFTYSYWQHTGRMDVESNS